MYDVKTTILGEFHDLGLCDRGNFWPETKVAIKLQVHSCNFKIKRKEKNIGYSFKLIGLYELQKVKIFPPLTPKKKQKEANKFIATSFKTKNTWSGLNLHKWIKDKSVTK